MMGHDKRKLNEGDLCPECNLTKLVQTPSGGIGAPAPFVLKCAFCGYMNVNGREAKWVEESKRKLLGKIRVVYDGSDGHGFHFGEIWVGGQDVDNLGIDTSWGAEEVWAVITVKPCASLTEARKLVSETNTKEAIQ